MIAIAGIQKTTLLDYPGKLAATIFLQGCNFRCPFCHNSILTEKSTGEIEEDELLSFLEKRKNLLDGVCITGGEPLLQKESRNLIQKIKSLGLLVKLDTNGSCPDFLKDLISDSLVDYVAMDIKNSPEHYAQTAGVAQIDMEKIKASASILMEGKIDFEFRTTVVKELHTLSDFEKIGEWLSGDEKYFLQRFVHSEAVFDLNLHAPEDAFLHQSIQILRQKIPHAALRGEDSLS